MKTKLPTLTQFKEWTEAQQKAHELDTAISDIDRDIAKTLNDLETASGDRPHVLDVAAEKILAGEDDIDQEQITPLRERLAKLRDRRKKYGRAKEKHQNRMETLRSELSKRIQQQVAPQYWRMVENYYRALCAVRDATAEWDAFRDHCHDHDISLGLLMGFQIPYLGRADDKHSRINNYLGQLEKLLNEKRAA